MSEINEMQYIYKQITEKMVDVVFSKRNPPEIIIVNEIIFEKLWIEFENSKSNQLEMNRNNFRAFGLRVISSKQVHIEVY
jgi:hypothetical protein